MNGIVPNIVYYYSWGSTMGSYIKIVALSHTRYEIEFQQTKIDDSNFFDIVSIYDTINKDIIDSFDSENLHIRTITIRIKVNNNPPPEKLFDLIDYV